MSISFSRSMRSLNADSFRPSLLSLILAMILLIAWLMWFFLAEVGFYETSENVRITQDGAIMAYFPLETESRIFPGQAAYLRFDGIGVETDVIPATVFDISTQADTQRTEVELAVTDPKTSIPLVEGLTGQVEIEIDRVSPATLVFQTANDIFDNSQNSLSAK